MTDIADEQARDAQARTDAAALKKCIKTADPDSLALLFTEARSHNRWRDMPVTKSQLQDLYDLAKMGPTSMNQQPMRLVFVQSDAAKAKLAPALMEPNRPKMLSAPVTAIIAYDSDFYEKMPKVFPMNPGARDMFASNPDMAAANAFRSGTL
jgi:3-hydroxypropanoate dehydrogenase